MSDDNTVRFDFKEPFLDFPILLGTANVVRRRLGGAGEVLPAGRAGRVHAEADRRRSLQAGLAGAGSEARDRGIRRLLPPGPHQAADHGQRAGGGDARRHAGARRGRHHLFRPGRIDRPGQEESQGASGARGLRQLVAGIPRFPGPKSPFHDKRVREAVSLAIDRDAINQAECGGMGVVDGNWINDDVEYGMPWPKWERNLEKAKQLMAEAGYPERLQCRLGHAGAELLFARRARRLAVQAIGIRSQAADDGARRLPEAAAGRPKGMARASRSSSTARASAAPGRTGTTHLKCGGFNGRDRNCVPELDAKFDQIPGFDRSRRAQAAGRGDPAEILENYYFVPVFRHAFVNAIGPRIAAPKWQDVFPTITRAMPIRGKTSSSLSAGPGIGHGVQPQDRVCPSLLPDGGRKCSTLWKSMTGLAGPWLGNTDGFSLREVVEDAEADLWKKPHSFIKRVWPQGGGTCPGCQ